MDAVETKHSVSHEQINLLSRLDRIPITRSTLGIMGLLALVWVIEAFDIGIVGQVVLVLRKLWKLTPGDIGLLGISSTIGVVIGLYSAGPIVDKFGRKMVLIWGVVWFTVFTVIGAAFFNLYWIVAMRFVAGLGEGAVFTLPYLMISEFCGSKKRGTLGSTANAILCAAYVIPAIVGAWALAKFDLNVAWRVPFLAGGAPIILVYFLAKWCPESPRWLLQRGRAREVRSLVEKLEREAGLASDANFVNQIVADSLSTPAAQQKTSVSALFKAPYLSRSMVSWSLYLATIMFWYIMLVYGPTIFADKGFKMGSAVMFAGTMTVIGAFGEVLIGHLTDTFGRKPVYLIFTIFSIVGCLLIAESHTTSTLIVGGVIAAFFGFGTLPVAKVYIAEQYPTYLRGAGTGVGEASARLLGGILAPYYIPFVLSRGGVRGVFWFAGATFLVVVIPFMIWGRETAGISVDQAGATSKAPVGAVQTKARAAGAGQ